MLVTFFEGKVIQIHEKLQQIHEKLLLHKSIAINILAPPIDTDFTPFPFTHTIWGFYNELCRLRFLN